MPALTTSVAVTTLNPDPACNVVIPPRSVAEQAEEANSRLGIRRKLRTAADDARRKFPAVRPCSALGAVPPHSCSSCASTPGEA